MLKLTYEVYMCTIPNKKGEKVPFIKCIYLTNNDVSITKEVLKEHAQLEIASVVNSNKEFDPLKHTDIEVEHLEVFSFGNVYAFKKK